MRILTFINLDELEYETRPSDKYMSKYYYKRHSIVYFWALQYNLATSSPNHIEVSPNESMP